jgi:hypothetical protein
MIFISPKVKEQTHFKSRPKISPFTNHPTNGDTLDVILKFVYLKTF